MALEQKGIVKEITTKNHYGNSGKYNCELIIDLPNEKFPQILAIECHNDKCDSVQTLKVGDEIKAFINVTSNNYQGRHYTKATLWKFELERKVDEPKQYTNPAQINTPSSEELPSFSEDEDVPF